MCCWLNIKLFIHLLFQYFIINFTNFIIKILDQKKNLHYHNQFYLNLLYFLQEIKIKEFLNLYKILYYFYNIIINWYFFFIEPKNNSNKFSHVPNHISINFYFKKNSKKTKE